MRVTPKNPSAKKLDHDDYVVAIICPLEVEMSAMRYMLDDEHAQLQTKEGDSNQYIYGRLSGHNVVIGFLPEGSQGIGAAATVATHMKRSFPRSTLRLLVGIGGGVPSPSNDIRLGDVVIGVPSGEHGGVIQYDLGKATTTGFQRKGILQPPPETWQTSIVQMKSNHRVQANKILTHISKMMEKYPSLTEYGRPIAENDVLFSPDNEHVLGETTCHSCDHDQVVKRAPRNKNSPRIFYGLIASGNMVVKDARFRDQIARHANNAMCVEMEAAGLMNDFKCVIIRGICDYADSHKNDAWHEYGAAAAAACAKELLTYVPPVLGRANRFLEEWSAKCGPSVEAREPRTGNTAIIEASVRGENAAVEMLLSMGASIAAANRHGSTALAEACIRNHTDVISTLLQHNADCNVVDKDGWSPFTRCIWSNQYGAFAQLIESGTANMLSSNTPDYNPPLVEACLRQQWDIVKLLLSNGADPNVTCQRGLTCLRLAATYLKDPEVIELFIKHGAKVDALGSDMKTAMHEAIHYGKYWLVETLLLNGASPNGIHAKYPYLCRLAMRNETGLPLIRLLLDHGANIEASNHDGWTALREAVHHGKTELVRELLKRGANANNRVKTGFEGRRNVSLLIHCAWFDHVGTPIATDLLDYGAEIEDADSLGWTALRAAVSMKRDDLACMLLLRGANPDAVALDGETPRSLAGVENVPKFMRYLAMRTL